MKKSSEIKVRDDNSTPTTPKKNKGNDKSKTGHRRSFSETHNPLYGRSTESLKMLRSSAKVEDKTPSSPKASPAVVVGSPSNSASPSLSSKSNRDSLATPTSVRSTQPSPPASFIHPSKKEKAEPKNFFVTDLGGDFFKYFKSKEYTDITIKLQNGVEHKAHRLILSYTSTYFMKLFSTHPAQTEVQLELQDTENIFEEVLEFMYSGRISIHEDNAIQLLAFSDHLSILELQKLVSEFLTSKVTRENAMSLLKRAVKAKMIAMIDKCIHVIAKHFCYMYELKKGSLNWLPYPLFLSLLHHDSLNVRDEYQLYSIVNSYIESNKDKLTPEEIPPLFDDIRFVFVTYSQLEEITKSLFVPRQLIIDAGLVRLAGFESPKHVDDLRTRSSRYLRRNRQPVTLDFDGKGKGILRWIGTNCESEEWMNPCTRVKGVRVLASSVERGQPLDLVRKLDFSELWTKDVPSSWFAVDLGTGRKAIPNYYTLVHGGNYEADILRNWYFQGSNDGENWTTLLRHQGDTSLNGKFGSASWPVLGITVTYRYFRILQTGHNSSDRNYLVLAAIEIYGELFEE